MKSYWKELWFNVNARRGFVNITGQVDQCLKESGVSEGLILVNAMHFSPPNTPLFLILYLYFDIPYSPPQKAAGSALAISVPIRKSAI